MPNQSSSNDYDKLFKEIYRKEKKDNELLSPYDMHILFLFGITTFDDILKYSHKYYDRGVGMIDCSSKHANKLCNILENLNKILGFDPKGKYKNEKNKKST